MAGNMHVPSAFPSCYRDGTKDDAKALPPRSPWAFDQGACCGDAVGADARERQLVHTPKCMGCVFRLRAIMIDQGDVQPYQREIANPVAGKAAELTRRVGRRAA